MKRLLLAALLMLVPWTGLAQNTNTLPPLCTVGTLTSCVPQRMGVVARVSDGVSKADCSTGSSTVEAICIFDGSSWVSTGIVFTGQNGDSIINSPNQVFNFVIDEAGTVTIKSTDTDANASLVVQAGGTGNITLGATTNPKATILTEGMNVDIDGNNSNTMSLENLTTGSPVLDWRDYGDTDDDDMAHAAIAVNCTTTTAGAEDCDMTVTIAEAGNGRTALTIDGDGDVTFPSNNTTATFGAPNKVVFNRIVGLPKLGATHIAVLKDGSDSAAVQPVVSLTNCSAIVNGAEGNDGDFWIIGSSTSYRYTWAADVAALDGIDCQIAYPATVGPTNFGMWFRTDTAIASGDIDINFDDGGSTEGTISTLAVTVLDEWQWIELDITAACAATCAGVDGIEFLATAQGAGIGVLDDAVIHLNTMAMWAAADEVAIGDIQVFGLIDFAYAPTIETGTNAMTEPTEWVNYIVNYQSGADAIVSISDLSANYGTTLEALN